MLDDEELLAGFLEEAQEHLSTIEPDLLELESNPGDMDTINRLFRSVHSIKGGAGFFGLDKMNTLAHAMENVMSKARTSKIVIGKDHTDALLLGLDRLTLMVDDISNIDNLDISKELELIESLSTDGENPVPVPDETVTVPDQDRPVENNIESDEAMTGGDSSENTIKPALADRSVFNIPTEEIDRLLKAGMSIYAVSLDLNQDILAKNKTPSDFINHLEEMGWFIDSNIEGESGDDLNFFFSFATIMEPRDAAAAVGVNVEQLKMFDEKAYRSGKGQSIAGGEPKNQVVEEASSRKVASRSMAEKSTPAEKPADSDADIAIFPLKEKQPAKKQSAESEGKKEDLKSVKTEESIRVSVSKLNKLVDLAGELVLVRNRLLQLGEKEGRKIAGFLGILQNLNMVTSGLQEEILNTRMQPISTVFGKFPRLIRELGTKLGKEISLTTDGNDVELDKTVLEALSDPLTHIVRNTADHGIEMPDQRKALGKTIKGELLLKAYHESGQVIIIVQDDGRGIDADKISDKAVEKGLIREEDIHEMNNQDKINLIFLPGFSTAEQISSVSGRGVGMDVVRSNIEGIGGSVELDSILGKGTTIKMTLPLTMAIVSCLIVQSKSERFAIPQVNLEELVIVKPEEVKTLIGYVQDKVVLRIRGELLPLISLANGLGIADSEDSAIVAASYPEDASPDPDSMPDPETTEGGLETIQKLKEATRILIVSSGNNRIGIIVDKILGTEEIVVKPMPEYLSHVTVFSGATILGDGTVAMILDTNAFIHENRLYDIEKRASSIILDEERKSLGEQQSILIFDNGTDEQFAVTIPLIQRVDTITMDQIQHIGNKEYAEYRGQQIRILRLADYLPIQKPKYDSEFFNIILPKDTRIPVAILIHKVLDTQTMKINLSEGTIHDKGIYGSTLIDGKITLLLDLYALLEMGEPESLYKINIETDKLKNAKVLLAEDTPMFLAVIREYLESAELDVTTVINGRQALEEMEKRRFDLILSDIEMPEMDGWGLIRAIRNMDEWKDTPVIALTSLDDEETIKAGLEAGFNDWIVKLDKHKILNCISDHLSKRI